MFREDAEEAGQFIPYSLNLLSTCAFNNLKTKLSNDFGDVCFNDLEILFGIRRRVL